jgi:hypothetical protein
MEKKNKTLPRKLDLFIKLDVSNKHTGTICGGKMRPLRCFQMAKRTNTEFQTSGTV